MTKSRKESLARLSSLTAAAVVAFCAGFLLLQHLDARHLADLYDTRLKNLEQGVKTDAQASVELTSEREWLTLESLRRERFTQAISAILMVGSAVFLASVNWLKSLKGRPILPRSRLVTLQTVPATGFTAPSKGILRPGSMPATGIDLSLVDHIVSAEGCGREAAIPILRAIQGQYGYLPDEALKRVCELTEVTPAQIAGTSTFYAQFRHSPVGKHIVRICHGTACHVAGIAQISEELRRHLGMTPDAETDPFRLFTLDKVACLGCCSLAPVMMIGEQTVGRLTPASACDSLHAVELEWAT